MMNCDLQWALDLTAESKRTAQRAVSSIGRNANGSMQVYDFSPVRTVLGVFCPISLPEGFDFSAVTKICPEKLSTSPSGRAMGKGIHSISPQVVDLQPRRRRTSEKVGLCRFQKGEGEATKTKARLGGTPKCFRTGNNPRDAGATQNVG